LPIQKVEVAPGNDQRGRIVQLCQQPRIKPLPQCQESRPKLFHTSDLALRFVAASHRRDLAPAPSCEVGKRREGSSCCPETDDQLAKSDGSDARGAQQSEAVD